MQTRWWGIVFLWVTFSFCAVVQPTTVPQQDLPYSFGEELEKIERDGFELKDYLVPLQRWLRSLSGDTSGKRCRPVCYRQNLVGAHLPIRLPGDTTPEQRSRCKDASGFP